MPTYLIEHLTRYSYQEPVSVCHHLAHLLPRETAYHSWHAATLSITPAPAVRTDRVDYFGNRMTFFGIQEPHRELRVLSQSKVDRQAHPSPALLFSSAAWEVVRSQIDPSLMDRALSPTLLNVAQFIGPSPYVQWNAEVAAYAASSFIPGRPIVEAALDLVARIHRDFVYDPRSTTVSTTLPEIMSAKSGVCQDFAHLLIGAIRSQGLAARYVSGYLLTTAPLGSPRLAGADASHAWASLFLPQDGGGEWLDLDPTNNLIPSDKHVTLALGRDFGDVSPIRGVILGGGRHQIHVSVDVAPA
jgi:transglutaminase-like putative cysteine protease